MKFPTQRDERLLQYAAERQAEYAETYWEHGSVSMVAKVHNVHKKTVTWALAAILEKAGRANYHPPELTHGVPPGHTTRGVSINRNADGKVRQLWDKSKPAGRDPDDTSVVKIEGAVTKTATYYDHDGNVAQQWVTVKAEDRHREQTLRAMVDELKPRIVSLPPLPAPDTVVSGKMAEYPIGDMHFGMLAWHEETGSNYDLSVAERVLNDAFDHLFARTPACALAVIPFMGDFLHYDSLTAVTPTSGHHLDSDGRFQRIVRVALRCMVRVIDRAATKHDKVHVIIVPGNHDPAFSAIIAEMLVIYYAQNERVSIDNSAGKFFYFRFGNNLRGYTHGDGIKPESLPGIMAHDRPEDWGATSDRGWIVGHVHHKAVKDFPGCIVESLRVLAGADAWHTASGYRSRRTLFSRVYCEKYGQEEEHTYNAKRLEA